MSECAGVRAQMRMHHQHVQGCVLALPDRRLRLSLGLSCRRPALHPVVMHALTKTSTVFLHTQVHRWGSALPAKPFGSPCLTAESALLAACGDFCLGAGVENAVLSGEAAAEAINSLLSA